MVNPEADNFRGLGNKLVSRSPTKFNGMVCVVFDVSVSYEGRDGSFTSQITVRTTLGGLCGDTTLMRMMLDVPISFPDEDPLFLPDVFDTQYFTFNYGEGPDGEEISEETMLQDLMVHPTESVPTVFIRPAKHL